MSADLVATLARLVGPAQVLAAPAECAPYLTDWRGRYRGAARCVVRPGTAAEVAAVVGACAAAGVPMVPQGGNTGLCGGATPAPEGEAVLIALGRLDRVRGVDAANRTLTAEAGCTLAAVHDAAAAVGCLFPLSLASQGSCQIGGNLATNAGGVQVLRYGTTRDLVLGIEAVLPDGRLWNGLRALRKDNTGYDLKQLFIGAEGTLGIITAASLKLFPRPAVQATAWINVSHPEAALALLGGAQQAFDARLTAFELVSEAALGLVMRHIPGTRRPTVVTPWYVLAEVSASDGAAPLAAGLEAWLARALAVGLVSDAAIAQSAAQAQALWHLRESISEAQKIEGFSVKHDIAVPVSRIPEFLARADALVEAAFPGLRVVAFGHVGDGNLHYNLSMAEAEGNATFIARQEEVHRRVHDLVHELGGSISAEHGLGQLKREEIRRYKSEVELDLMASVKAALDPRGLMNPGKVL
ncbi:MAG: FAD-binding oxidoreductase [Dechloromonas sp.]|nr:FAD-binding oxidoreductase [Dechloromonas sp.]